MRRGFGCGTCLSGILQNQVTMGRKRSPYPAKLLTKQVAIRLSQPAYNRLEKFQEQSDCRTVAELGRRILSNEKITCFHKDASMDAPLEELTRIRKELNAMGTNINQITHSFHIADTTNQKVFLALKVAEQYKKVGDKVDRLLVIVSELAKKWLQK